MVKVATTIGKTIGEYHPHGDAGLNGVVANLVRSEIFVCGKILSRIQKEEGIVANEVIIDSTTGGGDRRAVGGRDVNDMEIAPELVEDVAGCSVLADRGCDSGAFRQTLRSNNNIPVMPGRKNRMKAVEYDEEKYKKRGLLSGYSEKSKRTAGSR